MVRVAVTFFLALFQSVPADRVVDLVGFNRDRAVDARMEKIPETERVRPASRPVLTHSKRPRSAVEIVDLSFDRGSYKLGEDFVYEVTLRNTGNTPEPFPVSPDNSLFRKSHAGLRAVGLSLEFDDDVFRHQRSNFQMLYGSHDVQQTLVMLKKNETIKLRIPAKWVLQTIPPTAPLTWTRSITPYAQIDLYFTDENYQPIRSSKAIAIELSR